MQTVRTARDLQTMRDSVAWVGRISDAVVGRGRFSIGLDGVLSWIPGVGELYSAAAGAFILVQGARAGVRAPTLALAASLMLGRTAVGAIPLVGPAAADLFTAHKWSANLIVRAIDRRISSEPAAVPAGRLRRRVQPAVRPMRSAAV